MNERFDRVHQEILALTKSVATMDGKLDVLVGHIVDYKEAVRLTVRVEDLEKRVAELAKKVGG
jgi:rRNA pseudouridine-1189 N-methylase Emg1 (Nep1/Mra1 family)